MLNPEFRPLIDRFVSMYEAEEIVRCTRIPPLEIEGLGKLHSELACNTLQRALEAVFIPTQQTVGILQQLVGIAHAHAESQYLHGVPYATGCYGRESPLPDSYPALCLTGYAGCGKSEILKALARLLSDEHTFEIADGRRAKLQSHWGVKLKSATTTVELLTAFLPSEKLAVVPNRKSDLLNTLRKLAYRDGVCLSSVDEFQFASQSSEANSRVTSLLLSVSLMGIPFVYAANFSLINKLLKRNQEDRQRLLCKPIVLLPELPDSKDWIDTLSALKSISPGSFEFDAELDNFQLFVFTAGIKRILVSLLVQAYRIARKQQSPVRMEHIATAYQSLEFFANRTDVEIIFRQNVTGKKEREDLWCPIEIPLSARLEFTKCSKAARDKALSEKMLVASLSKSETAAKKNIEAVKGNPKNNAKVIQMNKGKKSAATLLGNAALLSSQ